MTAISQQVPNFWQGISQQPDSKKFPGQAKDLVNGYPNFALGLQKRPGGEHLCTLLNSDSNISESKFYHIFRDKTEKYILQFCQETKNNITLPNIKVWLLDGGLPRYVDRGELFGSIYETDQYKKSTFELTLTYTNNGSNPNPGTSRIHINDLNDTIAYHNGPGGPHHQSVDIQVRASNGTDSFTSTFNIPINYINNSGTPISGASDQAIISEVSNKIQLLCSTNFPGLIAPTVLPFDPDNRSHITLEWSNGVDTDTTNDDYVIVELTLQEATNADTTTFEETATQYRQISDSHFETQIATTTNGVTTGYQPDIYNKYQDVLTAKQAFNSTLNTWATSNSSLYPSIIFRVSNDYSNGTRDQALVDGVLVDSNDVETYYQNGSVVHIRDGSAETSYETSTYQLGNERTDEYPWFSSDYRIYEFKTYLAPDLDWQIKGISHGHAQSSYLAEKNSLTSFLNQFNTAVDRIDYHNITRPYSNYNITSIPDNYLTGATADDIEFLTDADTTYVLNKAKTVAWDETSQTPEVGNDVLMAINVVDSNTGKYEFTLEHETPNGIQLTTSWTPDGSTTLPGLITEFGDQTKWTTIFAEGTEKVTDANSSITGQATGTQINYSLTVDGIDYEVLLDSNDLATVLQAIIDKLNSDSNISAEFAHDSTNFELFIHKMGVTANLTVAAAPGSVLTLSTPQSAGSGDIKTTKNGTGSRYSFTLTFDPHTPADIATAGTLAHTFSFNTLESLIHLKFGEEENNDNNFNCNISNNSVANYVTVIQHETSSIVTLPIYGKHGYKVKVYNSADVDIDDFWMEFNVENETSEYGLGNWTESTAPGIYTKIDPKTMPHVLFRRADGTFVLKPHTWDERAVGDDVTNEAPSFIGKQITNMFFYRNRFGVLAGDSVVMTRAGDFENFFNKSAMAAADDDPIDIQASSTAPANLVYAATSAVGLVLFGTTQQFLMTTDSDLLSPETAKVNSLSRYSVREDLKAQSLGATNVFFSSTDRYLKTFEMIDITNTGSPRIIEQTIQVPKLLPADLDTASSSPSNSLLSLAKKEDSTMYHFKYYRTAESQVANSWYKWEFSNPVIYHFYDRNTFYVVHQSTSSVTDAIVARYELDDADRTGTLASAGDAIRFDPYLDMMSTEAIKTEVQVLGLDSNGDEQFSNWEEHENEIGLVVEMPSAPDWTNFNFYFVEKDVNGNVSSIEQITPDGVRYESPSTPESSHQDPYFILSVSDRARSLVMGIPYTFTLELPTIYKIDSDNNRTQADTVKNLVLHRTKFETGVSGPLTYTLNVKGKDTWTNTVAATPSQSYIIGSLPVVESDTHTIPIYQRNTDLSITVSDSSLYPATLLSMTWEGRYTSKFYQ